MRVVIDTNVWISFLIGKSLENLIDKIQHTITVLTSDELIEEVLDVLERPKLERYFTLDKKEFLLHYITRQTQRIQVTAHTNACRDKKDNYLWNWPSVHRLTISLPVTGTYSTLILLEQFT